MHSVAGDGGVGRFDPYPRIVQQGEGQVGRISPWRGELLGEALRHLISSTYKADHADDPSRRELLDNLLESQMLGEQPPDVIATIFTRVYTHQNTYWPWQEDLLIQMWEVLMPILNTKPPEIIGEILVSVHQNINGPLPKYWLAHILEKLIPELSAQPADVIKVVLDCVHQNMHGSWQKSLLVQVAKSLTPTLHTQSPDVIQTLLVTIYLHIEDPQGKLLLKPLLVQIAESLTPTLNAQPSDVTRVLLYQIYKNIDGPQGESLLTNIVEMLIPELNTHPSSVIKMMLEYIHKNVNKSQLSIRILEPLISTLDAQSPDMFLTALTYVQRNINEPEREELLTCIIEKLIPILSEQSPYVIEKVVLYAHESIKKKEKKELLWTSILDQLIPVLSEQPSDVIENVLCCVKNVNQLEQARLWECILQVFIPVLDERSSDVITIFLTNIRLYGRSSLKKEWVFQILEKVVPLLNPSSPGMVEAVSGVIECISKSDQKEWHNKIVKILAPSLGKQPQTIVDFVLYSAINYSKEIKNRNLHENILKRLIFLLSEQCPAIIEGTIKLISDPQLNAERQQRLNCAMQEKWEKILRQLIPSLNELDSKVVLKVLNDLSSHSHIQKRKKQLVDALHQLIPSLHKQNLKVMGKVLDIVSQYAKQYEKHDESKTLLTQIIIKWVSPLITTPLPVNALLKNLSASLKSKPLGVIMVMLNISIQFENKKERENLLVDIITSLFPPLKSSPIQMVTLVLVIIERCSKKMQKQKLWDGFLTNLLLPLLSAEGDGEVIGLILDRINLGQCSDRCLRNCINKISENIIPSLDARPTIVIELILKFIKQCENISLREQMVKKIVITLVPSLFKRFTKYLEIVDLILKNIEQCASESLRNELLELLVKNLIKSLTTQNPKMIGLMLRGIDQCATEPLRTDLSNRVLTGLIPSLGVQQTADAMKQACEAIQCYFPEEKEQLDAAQCKLIDRLAERLVPRPCEEQYLKAIKMIFEQIPTVGLVRDRLLRTLSNGRNREREKKIPS